MHTYIHTYMHTYIHIHTYTHIHYIHTYSHTRTYAHVHTHIYINTHTYTHTYAHTYTNIRIHTHTYIHTYRYTQTNLTHEILVPRARLAIIQRRAFSVVGPSAWNDLPFELRSLLTAHPSKFYISLKSFFFVCDWAGSASE